MNYVPCHLEGARVIPCSSLERALDHSKAHTSQGVHLVTFTNDQTGEISRQFVTLNTGGYRPNGVVMNVCPFCGEKIAAIAERDETAEEAADAD